MTFTASQALTNIELATAGKMEVDALSVLNLAGRHLVNMRNWNWLRGQKAVLGTVAGQEYISLPDDCKRIDAIEQTSSLVGTVAFVPLQEFLNYKTSTIVASPISFWVTVVWARDEYEVAGTERPGAPTMRLEVYPVPTSTNTDAFTMYYSREWVEVVEDNQALTMPPSCEALFLEVARAFAISYHHNNEGGVDQRLARIAAGATYQNAVRLDTQAQMSMGKLAGGIANHATALNRWSGAQITNT